MVTIRSVITSTEFQHHYGEYLDAARFGDVILITVHDRKRQGAVLISDAEYRRLKQIAKEQFEDGS